jgi:hypothetical protein
MSRGSTLNQLLSPDRERADRDVEVVDATVRQVVEDLDRYFVDEPIRDGLAADEGLAVLWDSWPTRPRRAAARVPLVGSLVWRSVLDDLEAFVVPLDDLPDVEEGDVLDRVVLVPAVVDGVEQRGDLVDSEVLLWDVLDVERRVDA